MRYGWAVPCFQMRVHFPKLVLWPFVCLLGAALAANTRASTGAAQSASRNVAQLNLDNLSGTAKDFAVKQALAAFGKTIGAQLPIVVAPSDGYPTTPRPPGGPFAPSTPPNVAGPLRTSNDGTVALPPGDYSFPVSVFCMRATAGSPPAHRYLVAPLRGSAADIITALNSRIPSYAIDHHVLQVLSWDIQAGLPYGAMGRDQRAAVDSIIPEYRTRLSGDVYEQLRSEYERTARNVPGMPSFESALQRLGPAGAEVVTMQNIRQQLAQPPPTFAQLARSLVPELPAGSVPKTFGETPWSRYSDRVFVRFVTDGNYATPGTYQVRVLTASQTARAALVFARFTRPSGLGHDIGSMLTAFDRFITAAIDAYDLAVFASAPVPFGNVVNNPGTDAVQPLTQAPLGAGPARAPIPTPVPTPTPDATIESETLATSPNDRRRLTVGVGEQVNLKFSRGQADWMLVSNGDGAINRTAGDSVLYTAAETNALETITARGRDHSVATITFQVIQPSGVKQRVWSGEPQIHTEGVPDIGFKALSYLTPDNVSFQFIEVKEDEVCGKITGGTIPPTGHHPNDKWLDVFPPVPGLGSNVHAIDRNYSGSRSPDALAPYRKGSGFVPSSLTWAIPWRYRVVGKTKETVFATVIAAFYVQQDGVSLYATKAGASASTQVDYPSSGESDGTGSSTPAAPDPCAT